MPYSINKTNGKGYKVYLRGKPLSHKYLSYEKALKMMRAIILSSLRKRGVNL